MDGLLQQLVTAQSDRRPERAAVVWQNQIFTYRELEERSNQLARALRAAGCDRGDRVCLLAPKSPMAVAAILGIYKADCIYVPVDAFGPSERLRRIVDICNPEVVLTVQSSAAALDEL